MSSGLKTVLTLEVNADISSALLVVASSFAATAAASATSERSPLFCDCNINEQFVRVVQIDCTAHYFRTAFYTHVVTKIGCDIV